MSEQDSKVVVLTAFHQTGDASEVSKRVKDREDHGFADPRGRSGQYNLQSRTKHVPGKPPLRSASMDSLDDLTLDDYWTELEHIQSSNNDQEQHNDLVEKVPDEGELEEEWLKEAGLSDLLVDSADPIESRVLLSTLTRTQAAAVQKRIEMVTQTLRKKNKQQQIPDVRSIFGLPTSQAEKISDANGTPSPSNNEEEKMSSVSGEPSVQGGQGTETDINLEISFSEQAASFKERSKNNKLPSEEDTHMPNFRLLKDKTGTTKIGDLAPQDMRKVHSLALIELTALFDAFGVDFKSHKTLKIKYKESGLFGVPLTILLEHDQKKVPGTKVPLILQKLLSHIEAEGLDTEGLLRIPGAAIRVKSLCQELESKFYDGTFIWENVKQHDAASLLKLFIRELPYPLLTVEYLNAFLSVQKLPRKKQQLQSLNLLVLLLPESSRNTLKTLLEFLQRVIENTEKNKMTLNNVAVVMAPNLFMFKEIRSKNYEQELALATGSASIMRFLIKYQTLLWTIPRFIMNQVRKQNIENQKKASKDRAMKKLLKKMAYDREKHEKHEKLTLDTDVLQGVIRVQAPQFSKVSMAIQLTEDLKASDVLARFLSQDSSTVEQSVKREELCLFEIGGNIGERCLDDDTYMKDLYQLNPTAEWVIKPRSQ